MNKYARDLLKDLQDPAYRFLKKIVLQGLFGYKNSESVWFCYLVAYKR